MRAGEERFAAARDRPNVHVQQASFTDMEMLATLLQHADCVVTNAGTVLLDALVNDRPVRLRRLRRRCAAWRELGREERARPALPRAAVVGRVPTRPRPSTRSPSRDRALPRGPASSPTSGAVTATVVGQVDGQQRRPCRRCDRRADRRMTASLVGIYRRENAAPRRCGPLAAALAAGWAIAWWALDDVAPELADAHGRVRGRGRGWRSSTRPSSGSARGPGRFVAVRRRRRVRAGRRRRARRVDGRAGLGLGQPAHAAGSEVSHGLTRAQSRSRARLATFVESGPVVVVMLAWSRTGARCARGTRGMGWGLELEWIVDLADEGCRLGYRGPGDHRPPRGRSAKTYDETAIASEHGRGPRGRGVEDSGAAPADARDVAPVAAPPLVGGRLMRLPWRKETPGGATSLLVDHWYSHAVGHVIEGLRRCQGYHACDPALRIASRPQRGVPGRARDVRAVRRRASTACRTRASARPSAARGARSSAFPATGTTSCTTRRRSIPSSSASRASGATTTPRGSTSAAAERSEWPAQAPPDYAPHQRLRLELPEHEREAAAGARRTPLDRRDAGRQRRPAPLPVDHLVARPSSTSSGGGSPTRPSRSSGDSVTGAVAPPAGSRAARSTTCSPRGPTPSTRSTGRSSTSSPWSRRRASSSHRTRDSASPRSPSGRRG